jgi:hypothetical protein
MIKQVKNNKEDSTALAKHASEITLKLFRTLETRDDLDSLKSSIGQFVEYVV